MTETVPTPAAFARTTSQRKPVENPCRKVRHATMAQAMDAAARRMLTASASPLMTYPCDKCRGHHVTSMEGGPGTVEVVAVIEGADARHLVTQGDLMDRSKKNRARSRVKRHWAGFARTRREEEAEDRIDRLPLPHLATAAEQEAFFASHARPSRVEAVGVRAAIEFSSSSAA